MLRIEKINAAYGQAQVLFDLSIEVNAGEIHCLLGRNGAGKTTIMKTIMGLLPLQSGEIWLEDKMISDLPAHEISAQQIGYVPQGRRLFGELTVAENIQIGLMKSQESSKIRENVLDIFPRLRERLFQRAETLSGGEQQMLATARALCVEPKLLLLDEPTEGLQPSMIDAIRDLIVKLRAQGIALFLVEQRIEAVLNIADRVTIIENGRFIETLSARSLAANPGKLHTHLGV